MLTCGGHGDLIYPFRTDVRLISSEQINMRLRLHLFPNVPRWSGRKVNKKKKVNAVYARSKVHSPARGTGTKENSFRFKPLGNPQSCRGERACFTTSSNGDCHSTKSNHLSVILYHSEMVSSLRLPRSSYLPYELLDEVPHIGVATTGKRRGNSIHTSVL